MRPLSSDDVVAPCDGRTFFYPDISKIEGFYIKGQTLSLLELTQSQHLASLYKKGTMIISRLAPVDYHRFHFPIDCKLISITPIDGTLHSVSPLALKSGLET